MMVPLLTILREKRDEHGIPMERFYAFTGMSRQSYFQALARHQNNQKVLAQIEPLVLNYRKFKDLRAGSRALYYNLDIKQKFDIGVNKFEGLMSSHGLTLAPLRTRIVTTQSSSQSWNYPDLVKGLIINGISQLVVGDLTYVSYGKYRYFLFCLTDVYSDRIVGHIWSDRMRAQEAIGALEKWVGLRGVKALKNCIHHTDGGSQYFSGLYLGAMTDLSLQVSVARSCLDNGFAEQRNGLLKHHLLPLIRPGVNGRLLEQEVKRIILLYNQERKQEKLGWKSPIEYEKYWAVRQESPLMKIYDRDEKSRTERFGF